MLSIWALSAVRARKQPVLLLAYQLSLRLPVQDVRDLDWWACCSPARGFAAATGRPNVSCLSTFDALDASGVGALKRLVTTFAASITRAFLRRQV